MIDPAMVDIFTILQATEGPISVAVFSLGYVIYRRIRKQDDELKQLLEEQHDTHSKAIDDLTYTVRKVEDYARSANEKSDATRAEQQKFATDLLRTVGDMKERVDKLEAHWQQALQNQARMEAKLEERRRPSCQQGGAVGG